MWKYPKLIIITKLRFREKHSIVPQIGRIVSSFSKSFEETTFYSIFGLLTSIRHGVAWWIAIQTEETPSTIVSRDSEIILLEWINSFLSNRIMYDQIDDHYFRE